MNVGGGEAADQLVRMMLSGTEVAVRLSGSALKNMLALSMALAKDRKTISGKVNMGKMLRETRDLRRFPMTSKQYGQFKKQAKKQRLLYSVIRDKDDRGQLMDVIMPVTELDRANAIFERILYTFPTGPERESARKPQRGREVFQPEQKHPERQAPEQAPEEQNALEQERGRQAGPVRPVRSQRGVLQQPAAQGTQGPEDTSKKDSRLGRDSHVIKISSSIRKANGSTRRTNDRPSVEARLKAYRGQVKKPSAPAKEKAKTAGKNRPKTR